MIRPSRWARGCLGVVWVASAMSSGCASPNPQATHEGHLLDNEVTAERVQAALRRAGPEFRHVDVSASREGIALTGSVGSADARSRAEAIAKQVDPHVDVSNRVRIR